MNPEHHMMSGHNSQRRQQEDLVAVLVYIMVSAEAQWRLTESLLQEEGSRTGRSLTPSRPMTASISLEFTEKVFCIKSWHNSQGPRTSHQVGTQQSKETARRSSSSFGLYHGQRRSPVETHTKSLLQEEGSRAGRSLTPSTAMTASIPLEFTEKVLT